MLREFAFRHEYLTTTANGPATTHGIDVDTETARGSQQWRADSKAATLARRREDNERILGAQAGSSNKKTNLRNQREPGGLVTQPATVKCPKDGGAGHLRDDHGRHCHRPAAAGLRGTCGSSGRSRGRGPS